MQSSFISASFGSTPTIGDGSASSWAVPELKEAMQNGLTYDGIMNNFLKPITREEFCIIVVKEYMNKPYPGDMPSMPSDFSDMYWGSNGKKTKFSMFIHIISQMLSRLQKQWV